MCCYSAPNHDSATKMCTQIVSDGGHRSRETATFGKRPPCTCPTLVTWIIAVWYQIMWVAIAKIEIPPSTIKGVREYLGFTGYYRRFVHDYSTVAQPLVRLLGKDCKFKWTDACQDAFKALRALLIKAPVLAFPKEDLPYIVDTNASDYGIGGVLSQCIKGTNHVVAYYSKSLNPAQQKYCTTRR